LEKQERPWQHVVGGFLLLFFANSSRLSWTHVETQYIFYVAKVEQGGTREKKKRVVVITWTVASVVSI
jgi:hypothetical protein